MSNVTSLKVRVRAVGKEVRQARNGPGAEMQPAEHNIHKEITQ